MRQPGAASAWSSCTPAQREVPAARLHLALLRAPGFRASARTDARFLRVDHDLARPAFQKTLEHARALAFFTPRANATRGEDQPCRSALATSFVAVPLSARCHLYAHIMSAVCALCAVIPVRSDPWRPASRATLHVRSSADQRGGSISRRNSGLHLSRPPNCPLFPSLDWLRKFHPASASVRGAERVRSRSARCRVRALFRSATPPLRGTSAWPPTRLPLRSRVNAPVSCASITHSCASRTGSTCRSCSGLIATGFVDLLGATVFTHARDP